MSWGEFWLVSGLVTLAAELIAAFVRKAKGDTITEHTRPWIRAHPARTAVMVIAWLWLGYHYFIEGP